MDRTVSLAECIPLSARTREIKYSVHVLLGGLGANSGKIKTELDIL